MVASIPRQLRDAVCDASVAPLPLSSTPVRLLLLVGAVERGGWNLLRPNRGSGGEAYDVARAIGDGRGFADAFGPGTGPTAHLLPISPGIGGAVYAALGTGSTASEIVLAIWSIGVSLASYVVFDRVFAQAGVARGARLVAFAFLCLAPTYLPQEAVDFRVWEGALAVLLLGLLLARLGTAEAAGHGGDGAATLRRDLPTIGVAVLLFLVNPLLGLAGVAGLVMCWWRHRTVGALVGRVAVYVAAVALLLTPWALRNRATMGAPVLLRSNLGLELAVGEYPGELAPGDGEERFMARLRAVHPRQSDEAKRALAAAGGEIGYSRRLAARTTGWMRAHPGTALAIAAVHVGQIVAPPPWSFRVWNPPALARLRSALASLAGLLGCIGLVAGLVRRPRSWTYLALAVLVPVALFTPFQPVMRYTYLFYAIFAFCAADIVWRLATRAWGRAPAPSLARAIRTAARRPSPAGYRASRG